MASVENIGTSGALSHHQDRQESVTGDSVFMHCRMTIFCTGSPWPLSLTINHGILHADPVTVCQCQLSIDAASFQHKTLFQLIQDKKHHWGDGICLPAVV